MEVLAFLGKIWKQSALFRIDDLLQRSLSACSYWLEKLMTLQSCQSQVREAAAVWAVKVSNLEVSVDFQIIMHDYKFSCMCLVFEGEEVVENEKTIQRGE